MAKEKTIQQNYKEDVILLALKAIENDMSQRKAAKSFKVPRATLNFNAIQNIIIASQKKQFLVRIYVIQESVTGFLEQNPQEV